MEEKKDLGRDNNVAELPLSMKTGITVKASVISPLNYEYVQNAGGMVIRNIEVRSLVSDELHNMTIRISSDSLLLEDWTYCIGQEDSPWNSGPIALTLNTNFLLSLTEKCASNIVVRVFRGAKLLAVDAVNIDVQTFDQWSGNKSWLPSFVMPNHPAVVDLIRDASKYLEKHTGDSALAGYQYGGPTRVKKQAEAVYSAIQNRKIRYSNPPASFGPSQRIRLPDAMLDTGLGTCMDMTLL